MVTSTADRVRMNTSGRVIARVDQQIQQNVDKFRNRPPAEVRQRLRELDREWDVERAIELEAPLTIGAGLVLGATVDRRLMVVPFFASAMLLLHGLQGWYPLIPVLRRMGFRTQSEIQRERDALAAQIS